MQHRLYFTILILLMITGALAQFNPTLEISTFYDNNLFRTPNPVTDVMTNVDLRLNFQVAESNAQFYYNPDIYIFNTYNERNFSIHGLGLSYFKDLNEDETHTLFLGADYNKRIDKTEFNFYDYNQFYAYLNFRFDLDWFFLRTGYNYRFRDYFNFSDLSNSRHYLFAQINKSFPTRTTFIAEVNYGRKNFSGTQTLVTAYSNNSGSTGGFGRGRWSGDLAGDTTQSYLTETLQAPSLDQMVLFVRMSQSIYSKMGIYLQYRHQVSLTSQTEYLNSDAYFQDEEIFDDPFSYESRTVASQLTWIMPFFTRLQIGGGYDLKYYISEQAYLSENDSLASGGDRQDKRSFLYLNLSKNFKLNKPWLNTLSINLNGYFTRNRSNSYWYDFRNTVFGGSISWSL